MNIIPNDVSKIVIRNSVIRGNGVVGVFARNGAEAVISGSTLSNNGIGARASLGNGSALAKMNVSDTVVTNNNFGVYLSDGARASISTSNISRNQFGVYALDSSTRATVSDSSLSINTNGLYAVSAGVIRITGNSISENEQAFVLSTGGIVETAGDNFIRGNASEGVGALTPIDKR